jgi:glycerophosphoryl diester phosphodiesterase
MSKKPIIFAHRGANRLAPENTLAAFELAYELGASAIELDVQLSADFVPVVIHDESLERTTSGSGLVADYRYDQLQKFSAGAWFNPCFADERIPSLRDVLSTLIPLGLYVNIEIKPNQLSLIALVNAVLNVIQDLRCPAEQILLSSFNLNVIEQFARLKPDAAFHYALLVEKSSADILQTATKYHCSGVNPSLDFLQQKNNHGFIQQAHQQNLQVFSFTLNDLQQVQSLLALGLDGFFTDNESLYHLEYAL